MKQKYAEELVDLLINKFQLNHLNSDISINICEQNGGWCDDNSIKDTGETIPLLTKDVIETVDAALNNKVEFDTSSRGCGNQIIIKIQEDKETGEYEFIIAQDYIKIALFPKGQDLD